MSVFHALIYSIAQSLLVISNSSTLTSLIMILYVYVTTLALLPNALAHWILLRSFFASSLLIVSTAKSSLESLFIAFSVQWPSI